MTEKCFKKCISKPGTSLDSSEQVQGLPLFYIIHIGYVSFRNVLLCAWTDIWTPGISFRKRTACESRGKGTCNNCVCVQIKQYSGRLADAFSVVTFKTHLRVYIVYIRAFWIICPMCSHVLIFCRVLL